MWEVKTMADNEPLKKVICLYRVSTKKQMDKDNDIPMQKESCRDFIKSHSNWILTKEYLEKGVSGYKKYAAQRDILQQVKQDAIDKKFDVLLVFMFDRLGRKEDETPFIVQWFTKQDVEVWSVKEGEQKFEHHVDKLMNYIRFWQASGESEKTSIRVDTKHRQMAHEGLFHGGTPPYGYHLVPSGILNKKKKELYKLEIDEEQSKIVEKIYNYVYEYGYGKSRVTQALNNENIPSSLGINWSVGTVGSILKNPAYKGYPTYGKRSNKTGVVISQPKENWILSDEQQRELIIIDESKWNKVQEIITGNRNSRASTVENKITKSPLLFVGKIHCGYCGSPMTTTYNYKYNKDKSKRYVYPKYRCTGKYSKCIPCEGKTIYSADIIENVVLKRAYQYLYEHYNESSNKLSEKDNYKRIQKEISLIERNIGQAEKEHQVLLKEVSKSLMGESSFKPDMLSSLIDTKEKEKSELQYQKDKLEQSLSKINQIEDYHSTIKDAIDNWDTHLKNIEFNKKKVILRTIIDNIIVYTDNIDITFNSKFAEFAQLYKQTKKTTEK